MIAIVSPHLDDAIFSVAEHMSVMTDVTIISVFCGTPDNALGRLKYQTLHAEHVKACEIVGAKCVNGPFLDDAQGVNSFVDVVSWLIEASAPFDTIWMPLGIHHPDHITATRATLLACRGRIKRIYEELPYRVLYPPVYSAGQHYGSPTALDMKQRACRAYWSQLNSDVERCIYAPERTWEVSL